MKDEKLRGFFSRHDGMALPAALVIVLFGSILVAGSFGFAVSSKKLATVRSSRYSDQVLASDYIEKTKGAILYKMSSTHRAIHPSSGGNWGERPSLGTVDGLLIDGPGLRADVTEGNRRVLLEVFDLTYEAGQLENTILNNPSELRRLPPMLKLTSSQMGVGSSMESVSKTPGVPNEDEPAKEKKEGSRVDLDYFGAYLIRVQLFRLPYSPGDKPVRVTEEAFFQVLDPNSSP
ncbi:MAG: hypothetical protein LBP21_07895 [Synergistaceae bacterium]|jgi:hypothetical protein|nr:hypothetical protein [Synergistaceae bacterium]